MTNFPPLLYTSTSPEIPTLSCTWNRYPFRVEPPLIGHCREYLPGSKGALQVIQNLNSKTYLKTIIVKSTVTKINRWFNLKVFLKRFVFSLFLKMSKEGLDLMSVKGSEFQRWKNRKNLYPYVLRLRWLDPVFCRYVHPSIFESLRLKQIYPKFSMDTIFGGFVKHWSIVALKIFKEFWFNRCCR